MKVLIRQNPFPPAIEFPLHRAFSDYQILTPAEASMSDASFSQVVLAASLNSLGYDPDMLQWLEKGAPLLEGARLGVFVKSKTPLHTREAGVQLIYHANKAGAYMPGRSLVEATENLENLRPLSGPLNKTRPMLLEDQLNGLAQRLQKAYVPKLEPRLSVWTIGKADTSATRAVWEYIRPHLDGIQLDFLAFGNENIRDCRGCAYALCKKMGEASRCIYEDYVVEKLYPSIEAADAILILTPNYNDMLPANFVSAINRMTALFRKRKFFDKNLYSLIVTGHTGAELLSRQLIGALHVNKTFALPPRFTWELQAHNVASVHANETLPAQAENFAHRIRQSL